MHTMHICRTSYLLSSGSNILTLCGKPIKWFFASFFLSFFLSLFLCFFLFFFLSFFLFSFSYFSNILTVAVDSYCSTGLHSGKPRSLRLLWRRDQQEAETPTWQHTTVSRDISMRQAGIEPAIPSCKRPKTHVLDCAAIATCYLLRYH